MKEIDKKFKNINETLNTKMEGKIMTNNGTWSITVDKEGRVIRVNK